MNKNPTVALVEDDASVRKALRRFLTLSGYEVLAFADGADFMAALASTDPDCVLMDVHMPGLCGFEVASIVRASGYGFPIVFMTGSCDDTMPSKLEAIGAASLLHKPFTTETLSDAFEKLFAGRRP